MSEKPITDEIRFTYMIRERIALTPELGGGWLAEVYDDEGEVRNAILGADPRDAIDAVISEMRAAAAG